MSAPIRMMQQGVKKERIVDLCIYVDKDLYNPEANKDKLFDSIYRIVYALSIKHKIFKNWSDYEPFALYTTCKIFQRATNPKQFLPDDDPKKMKKIKSILNFTKSILYPMQVDYQKETFEQQFGPEYGEEASRYIKESMVKSASSQLKPHLKVEFEYYLKKIFNNIKHHLKYSPYINDKPLMHNIYLSCLLTLLNQWTLSNDNKKRMEARVASMYNLEDFLNKIYIEEQENSIILFHLPQLYYNYISTLVAEIKKIMIKDLRALIGYSEPTEAVMQSILQSAKGEPNFDQD